MKKFMSIIMFLMMVSIAIGAAPQVILNNPGDGETGVSTSPTLNVTASDDDGDSMDVSFYDASKSWDLSTASYSGITLSAQNGYAEGLFFKLDGTKLYEIVDEFNLIYQYSCTEAWDLSSCSYDNINIPTQKDSPSGLFFSSDGTKLYEVGFDGAGASPGFYQYTCSEVWNLSSCSYDGTYLESQSTIVTGMFFGADGTKLYEAGETSNSFYQYTCSTPWELSSCSYDGTSILTQDGGVMDLFFKLDGTKLYEVGVSNDLIYQYTCSTPWDLSSCSYDGTSIATQDGNARGIFFKPDGTSMYEIGFSSNSFFQYMLDGFIGEETNVVNGSDVAHQWSGLDASTTYDWYVGVTDGNGIKISDTWNFTTSDSPNEPVLNNPSNGETNVTTSPVLNVTVTDPDADEMDVSF